MADLRSSAASVHEQARLGVQASLYDASNPYLSLEEKVEVESWFQLPGDLQWFTFALLAMSPSLTPRPLLPMIGWSLGINVAVTLFLWAVLIPKVLHTLRCSLLDPRVTKVVFLASAAVLAYNGRWGVCVFVLLSMTGVLSVLEPSVYLFAVLSQRYGMHPKYAYFKKFYKVTFPFEYSDSEAA